MPIEVDLTLQSDRRPEQLADLTRALARDLARERALEAREATRPAELGERASGVELLGQLVLTFLTGGAAKALLDGLRPYFERDRSLVVALKTRDGTELRIEGKDLRPDRVAEITEALRSLAGKAD
jgi:hypothetical protein